MTVMAMLSQPGAFPDLNELQISLTSWVLVGFRIMDSLTVLGKKDQKERLPAGIFPARLGPMFVKYLQNPLAISKRSVTVLPSTLKNEGREGFAFLLLIISFIKFYVSLRSVFARSNLNRWIDSKNCIGSVVFSAL